MKLSFLQAKTSWLSVTSNVSTCTWSIQICLIAEMSTWLSLKLVKLGNNELYWLIFNDVYAPQSDRFPVELFIKLSLRPPELLLPQCKSQKVWVKTESMAHNFNYLLDSSTALKPSSTWFLDYKCWYLKDSVSCAARSIKWIKYVGFGLSTHIFLPPGEKFNCFFLLMLIRKPNGQSRNCNKSITDK